MGLAGKTALVTGATSGIGAETARAFAREGATVVLTGRSSERGERLLAELDTEATFIQSELGTSAAADSLVSATVLRFGRLDVLVNSAGVVYHETVPETSDAHWEETMAINVSAVFYLSRAAVREMNRHRRRCDRQRGVDMGAGRRRAHRRLLRLQGRGVAAHSRDGGRPRKRQRSYQ